jgi:hypothetical protein
MTAHYNQLDWVLSLKEGDAVLDLQTRQKAVFSHSVSPALCSSKLMVYLSGRATGLDSDWIAPITAN